MRSTMRAVWIVVGMLAAVAVPRSGFANSDHDGGNLNIDLAVRQVTVTPVRAHAGDTVRVDVVIENKAEGRANTFAELLVNGKVSGRQLFTWGTGENRLYRLSFDWDTKGVRPGEYRIGAQVFLWEDSSPFDNRLDVSQPVIVAPAGGAFPGGAAAGGSATETDPRFGKRESGG